MATNISRRVKALWMRETGKVHEVKKTRVIGTQVVDGHVETMTEISKVIRRKGSGTPLKVWARALYNDPSNPHRALLAQWMMNKRLL